MKVGYRGFEKGTASWPPLTRGWRVGMLAATRFPRLGGNPALLSRLPDSLRVAGFFVQP